MRAFLKEEDGGKSKAVATVASANDTVVLVRGWLVQAGRRSSVSKVQERLASSGTRAF